MYHYLIGLFQKLSSGQEVHKCKNLSWVTSVTQAFSLNNILTALIYFLLTQDSSYMIFTEMLLNTVLNFGPYQTLNLDSWFSLASVKG